MKYDILVQTSRVHWFENNICQQKNENYNRNNEIARNKEQAQDMDLGSRDTVLGIGTIQQK